MSREALEVTVTAPVASFRNPLYFGMQVGLPCPPPSTVGGMLAAAAGGWHKVKPSTRFAMAFHAQSSGTDLETFHPLDKRGRRTEATPKDRDYLWGVELTVWLVEDCDFWYRALRRPVWPLKLGRSQDLAEARPRYIDLHETPGTQGHAVVPGELGGDGTMLRLPTAISLDRSRTRWGTYRYDRNGSRAHLPTGISTEDGRGVVLLPEVHPSLAEEVA
ncbi:CRISPR-associated protein Cas5 [Saccharopolyspora sp. NPDC003762]